VKEGHRVASVLKNLPIFKNLTDKDIERLEKLVHEVSHSTGHVLFKQGDAPDAFYIIKTGNVDIVIHSDDEAKVVNTLSDGEFFGEIGVIEDSPRMADVVLTTDATFYSVEKHAFQHFMAINPSISMKVMCVMARRYRAKPQDGEEDAVAGEVIGIFSATGGVGNSLVASNLSVALKKATGKSVVLLDLDMMFGDQAGIFNVIDENSLAKIHGEEELDYSMIEGLIIDAPGGIGLLQAPPRPEESELVSPDMINVVIELLKPHWDYVVLDTANAIQDLAIMLLESVDKGIYVLTPEFLSVKNAHRWLKIVQMINIPTQNIEIVLNKDTQRDASFHDEIEKQLRKNFVARLPYDFETCRLALNKGKMLVTEYPESGISKSLVSLASIISGITAPEEREDKSFWKRLTRW